MSSSIKLQSRKYQVTTDGIIGTTKEANLFEYFDWDNFYIDAINDDSVSIGGYAIIIKSFPKKMYTFRMWSEFENDRRWDRGPIDIRFLNFCEILLQPNTQWYPVTNLFTNCPPVKGVSDVNMCQFYLYLIKQNTFLLIQCYLLLDINFRKNGWFLKKITLWYLNIR